MKVSPFSMLTPSSYRLQILLIGEFRKRSLLGIRSQHRPIPRCNLRFLEFTSLLTIFSSPTTLASAYAPPILYAAIFSCKTLYNFIRSWSPEPGFRLLLPRTQLMTLQRRKLYKNNKKLPSSHTLRKPDSQPNHYYIFRTNIRDRDNRNPA